MLLKVKFLPGEYFWGGATGHGTQMPVCEKSEYDMDFRTSNRNQFTPLFLSSKGRYVWSDNAFRVWTENGYLCFDSIEDIALYEAGTCLRDAYRHAMKHRFPFENKTLPREFFKTAQYNTWMEYTYDPTQQGVLDYARNIIKNGMKPGILIIDEGWHTRYGLWEWDFHKFPDPKEMLRELHAMGFTVMLWVTPFVTCDGKAFTTATDKSFNPENFKNIFLRNKAGDVALVKWWNGISAVLDLRKECDREFLDSKLRRLMQDYGVDGFKFDGGSFYTYGKLALANGEPADDADAKALNIAWNDFGRRYTFHEYKDTFMGMGKVSIQRLCDRKPLWDKDGINTVIPCSLLQGLMGYPFICPDMIGGGEWAFTETPGFETDEELFVRMAQASALFPMMQFSWAPWRVLSEKAFEAVKAAARLHCEMSDKIIACVSDAEKTGEPIVRPLEYNDPGKGFESVTDQFMLGTDILVCPVVTKGTFERDVVFPKGTWKDSDGNVYPGRTVAKLPSPTDKLLWFEKIEQ